MNNDRTKPSGPEAEQVDWLQLFEDFDRFLTALREMGRRDLSLVNQQRLRAVIQHATARTALLLLEARQGFKTNETLDELVKDIAQNIPDGRDLLQECLAQLGAKGRKG